MFICRTRTGSHGGKTYFTYRLVRSRRIGAKVRQQTLLNLGSRFPIRREHRQALSRRSAMRWASASNAGGASVGRRAG